MLFLAKSKRLQEFTTNFHFSIFFLPTYAAGSSQREGQEAYLMPYSESWYILLIKAVWLRLTENESISAKFLNDNHRKCKRKSDSTWIFDKGIFLSFQTFLWKTFLLLNENIPFNVL